MFVLFLLTDKGPTSTSDMLPAHLMLAPGPSGCLETKEALRVTIVKGSIAEQTVNTYLLLIFFIDL